MEKKTQQNHQDQRVSGKIWPKAQDQKYIDIEKGQKDKLQEESKNKVSEFKSLQQQITAQLVFIVLIRGFYYTQITESYNPKQQNYCLTIFIIFAVAIFFTTPLFSYFHYKYGINIFLFLSLIFQLLSTLIYILYLCSMEKNQYLYDILETIIENLMVIVFQFFLYMYQISYMQKLDYYIQKFLEIQLSITWKPEEVEKLTKKINMKKFCIFGIASCPLFIQAIMDIIYLQVIDSEKYQAIFFFISQGVIILITITAIITICKKIQSQEQGNQDLAPQKQVNQDLEQHLICKQAKGCLITKYFKSENFLSLNLLKFENQDKYTTGLCTCFKFQWEMIKNQYYVTYAILIFLIRMIEEFQQS